MQGSFESVGFSLSFGLCFLKSFVLPSTGSPDSTRCHVAWAKVDTVQKQGFGIGISRIN